MKALFIYSAVFVLLIVLNIQAAQGDVITNTIESYENGLCYKTDSTGENISATRITLFNVKIEKHGQPLSYSQFQIVEGGLYYCKGFVEPTLWEIDISKQPVSYQSTFESEFSNCLYKYIKGYFVEVSTNFESFCDW